MNSATLKDPKESMQDKLALSNPNSGENEFAYRSISKAAIASIIFAVLGALTSFLAAHFVILPALGLVFGLIALASFRRYPEELTGKLAAKAGIVLGLVCLVGATAYHTYIYNTEVPEGYRRISYGDLRPNSRTHVPFSEKAREFDGNKVFLKGYVRPSAKRRKLKNFILVGDFGDCCFGGNPKMTEVVAVKILGDDTIDHGYTLRKIGGTFRLNESRKRTSDDEVPLVYYEIEADHIR